MKQGCRSPHVRHRTLIAALAGSFAVLGLIQTARANQELPPSMVANNALPLDSVAVKAMPALDIRAIAAEDLQRQAKGDPLRFAIPNLTEITPSNSGTWEKIDATTMLWRLRITCPNAVSMNLGFTRFTLPDGARLFMYNNKVQNDVVRPFSKEDNRDYKQLWTPIVISNDITVELSIAEAQIRILELTLGSINLGYWDFTNVAARDGDENAIASTGGCNIDAICSQGDAWRPEIQSVARITIGGAILCSGWMTNNTANDQRNFFMTANHCGLSAGNAGTLVTYWNYFNSTCRPTSPCGDNCVPPGNGSLSQFISGSVWRAAFAPSDFTLTELSSTPSPAWQVTYAGWSREGINSPSGAGIHHPQGEEKRISLYTAAAYPSNEGSNAFNANGNHVHVNWSTGVTEGGSSGSPLFDVNKRAIGQLHSGASFCSNPFAPDWYGRFLTSWTGGGTASSRLSNWLDPLNTGALTLNTIGLAPPAPANDTCAAALVASTGSTPFTSVSATTDGPDETGCGFLPPTQIGNDVWFKWVTSCTGTATMSLCGASFNTRMAVYFGCPTMPGQTLACNDNFCGPHSQVTFPCTLGQLLRIRIGGAAGITGTGTLVISCTPAPVCPADVNNSGSVNIDDLVIVITNWGAAGGVADINDDNMVNIDDLVLVITAWGPC